MKIPKPEAMKNPNLSCLALLFFCWACGNPGNETKENSDLIVQAITLCKTTTQANSFAATEIVKLYYPRMVYADDPSDYPKIKANNNLRTAGVLADGLLTVNLEVTWGDFYMETEARPGLHMTAIGEQGDVPSIPGPLIRVETGTRIRATIHNSLSDSTISVFGMQTRPAEVADSVFILPGESKTVEFDAGDPGTYLYWVRLGNHVSSFRSGFKEQLGGAFIIDPKGASKDDRILVINVFTTPFPEKIDSIRWLASYTINGRSWPYTELFQPEVGDTVNWRVINASVENHPMHLHGFYYDVLSRGDVLKDKIYKPELRRKVVTEFMTGRTTMNMQWIPRRPGRWLLHCHLSFHVNNGIRLPDGTDGEHAEHMAGLVTGINVQPGPSDLLSKGVPREIKLFANSYESGEQKRNGFSMDGEFKAEAGEANSPGPLLVLKQYQPTYITMVNRMSEPTSIHWHGLEIDSWSDGVPEWSSSEGKMSPSILPGEKFRYKLSLMRPGTFIYHSHLDDINQLTSGLYGPMIVMAENETYDPETDHPYIVGWKIPFPKSWDDLELNGLKDQPLIKTHVGVTHRLRLMNIAPAGRMRIRMEKDSVSVPLTIVAKDGADLPASQREEILSSFRYGVGETADFEFTPTSPGNYKLYFWNNEPENYWVQDWVVAKD
ncbi:MAG: multicopper oxidase domain-containing protein [Cyclobacteriaceae bacterium]|nr:multicopper oxidase domain-containing protein [Cyclobacteriaceae bacterium]